MSTRVLSSDPNLAIRVMLLASLPLVTASGIGAQASLPTVDAREEIRIASNDSVPGMLLTGIADLAVLPDGRILTTHRREAVLRVFDSNGRLTRVVGRRGGGPGEFEGPGGVGFVGDRIWVNDPPRYQLFDARSYEPAGELDRGPTGGYFLGLASDSTSFYHAPADDSGRASIHDRRGRRRLAIDLPIRLAGHHFEMQVEEISPAGMRTGRTVSRTTYSPLVTATQLRLVPGGREVVVLEASELWNGPPGHFTIRRIETATGRVSAPVTVALPARRVTRSEADSLINEMPALYRSMAARDPRVGEQYRGKAKAPDTYPAFMSFVPSADGVLWLREYARPDTWVIVDVAGKALVRVRLPTGFIVKAVSRTHVWGYTLDADDLPIISRYRVQPVTSASSR